MLFAAFTDWLVAGTVPNLYIERLPEKDSAEAHGLAVAFITDPGDEPEKFIGGGDRGNVAYFSTGITFEARAKEGSDLAALAALIRVQDRVLQLHGAGRTLPANPADPKFRDWQERYGAPADLRETILLLSISESPHTAELDPRQRVIARLSMTVAHVSP